jgi:hypothetical protein
MSVDNKRWRLEMKKSLISVLMIGLLVFGLVLVGCDNGTTDDPPDKVIAEQFRGKYIWIGSDKSNPQQDPSKYYVFSERHYQVQIQLISSNLYTGYYTEGNILKSQDGMPHGTFEYFEYNSVTYLLFFQDNLYWVNDKDLP